MSVVEIAQRLLLLAKTATPGPYVARDDYATECGPHRESGLARVDSLSLPAGKFNHWPIARLSEWNNARFTEACTPETISTLAQAVIDQDTAAARYRAAVDLGLLDEDELDERLSSIGDILIDAIKAVTPK